MNFGLRTTLSRIVRMEDTIRLCSRHRREYADRLSARKSTMTSRAVESNVTLNAAALQHRRTLSRDADARIAEGAAISERVTAFDELLMPPTEKNRKRVNTLLKRNEAKPFAYPYENGDPTIEKLRKIESRTRRIITECDVSGRPLGELRLSVTGKKAKRVYELTVLRLTAEILAEKVRSEANEAMEAEQAHIRETLRLRCGANENAAVDRIIRAEDGFCEDVELTERAARELMAETLPPGEIALMEDLRTSFREMGELPAEIPECIPVGDARLVPRYGGDRDVQELMAGYRLTTGLLRVPLFWDRKDNNNLWLDATHDPATGKKDIVGIVDKLIRFTSVSKQTFLLFDPEERGDGFKPFAPLFASNPNIVGGSIVTNADALETRLAGLCARMDETLQKKLPGFRDYYHYATTVPGAHPFETVVILDYPKSCTERALEYIGHLVENGSKCGIDVVIHQARTVDEEDREIYKRTESLRSKMIRLDCSRSNAFTDTVFAAFDRGALCGDSFTVQYGIKAATANSASYSYMELLSENDFQTGDASQQLRVPVGRTDGGEVQYLELGKKTSHGAVVTGAVGSGKSTLLHNFINGCMWYYAPDEVQMALLDFKGGTEFNIYAGKAFPHISLLAIDTKQEFGESILEQYVAEYERRIALFKNADNSDSLEDYRKKSGKKLPRLLLIIDEYQSLYNIKANRQCALNAADLTNTLVTKGRAYGIHLILSSQSLNNSDTNLSLYASTLGQMNVRIGLSQERKSMVALFGENGDDAYERLTPSIGSAVYNADYTLQGGNVAFVSAYLSDDEKDRILKRISESLTQYPCVTRIFEGDRLPEISLGRHRETTADQNSEHGFTMVLGQPIRVATDVTVSFGRRKRGNLLILGRNERLYEKLCHATSVGLTSASQAHRRPELVYVDGKKFADGQPSEDEVLLKDGFAGVVEIAERDEDIPGMIAALYQKYCYRKENPGEHPYTTVYVRDVQWVDTLKDIAGNQYVAPVTMASTDAEEGFELFDEMRCELEDSSSQLSHTRMLKELIVNGYRANINFIFALSDYQVLQEELYEYLADFPNRVIFALPPVECERIVRDIDVSFMDAETAVFANTGGTAYQFRPYHFKEEE